MESKSFVLRLMYIISLPGCAMCQCMRPFHMFHRSGWRKPLGNLMIVDYTTKKKGILLRQGQGPGVWYNSQGIYTYTNIIDSNRDDYTLWVFTYLCISYHKCYQAHLCFQNQRLSISQVMIKREASPLPRYVVYLMLNWRDTPPWN